nr:glycosyltransferase [Ferrimicrobium acidiphilum]
MRIVVDLQGAQATSRNRGIGRHSQALAMAIAKNADTHDVRVALSGLFPETIESIRDSFDRLLPQDHIHVWRAPGPVCEASDNNAWRRNVAERIREAFLAALKPDVVHISSLFEGLSDDAVTSIGVLTDLPTSMTLYDLIPLVHRETYLTSVTSERWYERKLAHLRRAHLWLAISESARREAIEYLELPEESVVNISSAADPQFQPRVMRPEQSAQLRERYGLNRPFIMYTGGIDHRKNIEGLIRAYALLPAATRHAHQLVIVCSVNPEEKSILQRLVSAQAITLQDVVFTGFVPDDDLTGLYNLCQVFIFPSWHEGFGLPVLEAMSCGAATIGAAISSTPEVIGRADALFDPHSDGAMAAKLSEVLGNDSFREELRRHGIRQARKFSWDETARRSIEAFERIDAVQRKKSRVKVSSSVPSRPRLAYVSPLPPERTGIADYSVELLPELSRHYDIDAIVRQPEETDPIVSSIANIRSSEWFDSHAHDYDRVLYQVGNSTFHEHMFPLLERHPGIVVLHDFFLSGILAHLELRGLRQHAWTQEIYRFPGYGGVRERLYTKNVEEIIERYPCNLSVLQHSLATVVHSTFALGYAEKWYGKEVAADWAVIPHLKRPPIKFDRSDARTTLGFSSEDFLICSFGWIANTKLNDRILQAWISSPLAREESCHLVFVGGGGDGEYGSQILETVRRSRSARRIRVTGFVSQTEFQRYLMATDVAVQLRTRSRGETSGAVLNCLAFGVPTVVNAHGPTGEIPADCVLQLPEQFADAELSAALESLWRHPDERRSLGEAAKTHIRVNHSPRHISDLYTEVIESAYCDSSSVRVAREKLIRKLSCVEEPQGCTADWVPVAECVATSFPLWQPLRQLLVDVTAVLESRETMGEGDTSAVLLRSLLDDPPAGFRVEPIYRTPEGRTRYARRFTLQFMGCPEAGLNDDVVELFPGDHFLILDWRPDQHQIDVPLLGELHRLGGKTLFVVNDIRAMQCDQMLPDGVVYQFEHWLQTTPGPDGVICSSRVAAGELARLVREVMPHRVRPLRIGYYHAEKEDETTTGSPLQVSTTDQDVGCPLGGEAGVLPSLDGDVAHIMELLGDDKSSYWVQ